MIKFKKLSIIFFMFFIFTGCKGKDEVNKTPRVDFELFANKYLNKYPYDLKELNTSNSTEMSEIKISRKYINKSSLNLILSEVKKDGWIEVENDGEYIVYCRGKINKISILDFNQIRHVTSDKSELIVDGLDHLYITFYYNRLGINDCDQI